MDAIQTLVNAAVMGAVGLLLALLMKGEGKARRREIDQLRGEIGDLRAEMGQMRIEMSHMRSDLTRVALAVGAGPASEAGVG